jgi:long-subunit acyl-CoA synthetase (AMP-forming)
VAPEKVEAALRNSSAVFQVFVHGNSVERYLVAVAVPDPEWCGPLPSPPRSQRLTGMPKLYLLQRLKRL